MPVSYKYDDNHLNWFLEEYYNFFTFIMVFSVRTKEVSLVYAINALPLHSIKTEKKKHTIVPNTLLLQPAYVRKK